MAKLSMQELAVQYGFAAAFFNSDPELKKLIKDATSGQWSVSKFQAKFMATKWYRAREASVRQWADLAARDPKEAQNKINERKAEMADQFSQLGITISDSELTKMASNSLQYSWSDAQRNDIMASYVKYTPGGSSGGIAALETQIKDLAYQNGVSVSDAQMQDWISGMVAQKYTQESLEDYIRDMAKSKYGGMTSWLDTGMTVRQVAAPYLQEYAKLLETDPNTVDLDDPLIAQALQGKIDPKTGQPQMMTVAEMQRAVKQDKRWLYTSNAKTSMTDMGIQILQDMGLYS